MKNLIITAFVAVAMLTACSSAGTGGSTPVTNAQFAGGHAAAQPTDRRGSDPLVYVVDEFGHDVKVFDYPSLQLVQTLTDVPYPRSVCVATNADNANIWVGGYDVAKNSELVEYAHGGTTPIATLSDEGPQPVGCAPVKNGRLLAADSDEINGVPVLDLAEWNAHKPSMPPTKYTNVPNAQYLTGIARDQRGAVYISGYDADGDFILDKFQPYRFKTFSQIPISIPISEPGPVYAIGPKLFISDKSNDADHAVIYQINPTNGSEMATTTLNNSTDCESYAVAKIRQQGQQQLFCPNVNAGTIDIYNFPQGGNATGHITGLQYPVAVVVSRIPPSSPAPSPTP
jgi:hypothetical protein